MVNFLEVHVKMRETRKWVASNNVESVTIYLPMAWRDAKREFEPFVSLINRLVVQETACAIKRGEGIENCKGKPCFPRRFADTWLTTTDRDRSTAGLQSRNSR